MTYTIIDIPQQTDEWRQWRKTKIGSSDIASIMGVDPWCPAYKKWRIKMGLFDDSKTTPAMQRGIDMEPLARSAFEEEHGFLMPSLVVQSTKYDWMISSLDGINFDRKETLEIKCPGKKTLDEARNGIIPENYYVQVQHQLYMSGFDLAYYYCFDGEKGITIEINRNDYMIDQILEKCIEFNDSLINMEPLKEWVA